MLAACLARLAAQPADEDLETRVHTTLDRARSALVRALNEPHGSRLALFCLAAAHDGLRPGDDDEDRRRFGAALARLEKASITDTYGLALRLMAREAVGGKPDLDAAV